MEQKPEKNDIKSEFVVEHYSTHPIIDDIYDNNGIPFFGLTIHQEQKFLELQELKNKWEKIARLLIKKTVILNDKFRYKNMTIELLGIRHYPKAKDIYITNKSKEYRFDNWDDAINYFFRNIEE
jgi:hypothetical protein